MDWRAEAQAQAHDVREGVAHVEVDAGRATAHGAVVVIGTHEGTRKEIELRIDGCRQIGLGGEQSQVFDSLHSLLMNTSDGYKRLFHESLTAKLSAIAARRATQE